LRQLETLITDPHSMLSKVGMIRVGHPLPRQWRGGMLSAEGDMSGTRVPEPTSASPSQFFWPVASREDGLGGTYLSTSRVSWIALISAFLLAAGVVVALIWALAEVPTPNKGEVFIPEKHTLSLVMFVTSGVMCGLGGAGLALVLSAVNGLRRVDGYAKAKIPLFGHLCREGSGD
jgi:hypothetical protein